MAEAARHTRNFSVPSTYQDHNMARGIHATVFLPARFRRPLRIPPRLAM